MNNVPSHRLSTERSSGASRCSGSARNDRWAVKARTLDPLIKSANQRVQPNHTDELNTQQLELWPDSQ